MSNSLRPYLLQSFGKYRKVVPEFLKALRSTGYFNKFYYITDPSTEIDNSVNDVTYIFLDPDAIYKSESLGYLGWSNDVMYGLEYVKEDVFFMSGEDHLLVDFDECVVHYAFGLVERGFFGCIRLTHKPQIILDKEKNDDGAAVHTIDKSYKYYVSLQPTVWNKKYLQSILRPNESAWQFEILASQRAKKLDLPVGVTYKTAFNYRNLIEKGKLVDNPKTYTEIHGV